MGIAKICLKWIARRRPGQIAFLTAGFYFVIAVFMLWRIPDLHPELANFPDRFFLFVRPGAKWDPDAARPYNLEYIGYDGQWYYDLARNPFDPATSVDKPAYRSARLLYPLLVWGLAFGHEEFIPMLLFLVNFVAIIAGTYWLARIFASTKRPAAWALGYAIWPGTVCALFYDLSEPLCFALVILALFLYVRRPGAIWEFGVLLLLASLTKELAILFGVGWLTFYLYRREWRKVLLLGASWLLPFMVWQLSLWLRFGKDGLSAGEPFSWFPLAGYFAGFSHKPSSLESVAILATTILPLLWVGWLIWRAWRNQKYWIWNEPVAASPWLFTLGVHGAFLLFLPAASFIYIIDHARNQTGLLLTLYLFPLASFNRLRIYLLLVSLGLSGLLLAFYVSSGTAFLYFFGL